MTDAESSKYALIVSAEDRNLLTEKLERKGWSNIDSSGTRAVFEDGDFVKFLADCEEIAKKSKGKIVLNRVLRCEDPGLGICMDFPEDMGMRARLPPLEILNFKYYKEYEDWIKAWQEAEKEKEKK